MTEDITVEECSNEECTNTEARMATVLTVGTDGITKAKRLCKSCVSVYLNSRK